MVGALRRRRRDESPDEALLRAVYEEHGQAVLAYANRLVRDRHAAADVVQETFLRAWRHPEVLVRGHGRLRGWLLAVARNIVIDRARALAIRPQEVADVAIELGGGGIAAEPDHAERVAAAVAVTSAMAGLSGDHQQVLRHLYWGDRSVADTAADIGITVGTVKSRAHYAIAALRKALARRGGAVTDLVGHDPSPLAERRRAQLLTNHALGLLSESEARDLEAHLAGCAQCCQDWEAIRDDRGPGRGEHPRGVLRHDPRRPRRSDLPGHPARGPAGETRDDLAPAAPASSSPPWSCWSPWRGCWVALWVGRPHLRGPRSCRPRVPGRCRAPVSAGRRCARPSPRPGSGCVWR